MSKPRKILAVKLRAIGDTVIWTSALNTLRKSYPQAEIHALTYKSNAAILQNHPSVDQLHFLSSHSRLELVRTLWRLREERFDWLLGFHATTSLCRWAWLAGARKLALHHHSWPSTPRGSVLVPHAGDLEDAISRDHRVLEAMEGRAADPAPTSIHLTDAETQWAEEQISERILNIGGDPQKKRWVFLPGGSHKLKRYPKKLLFAVIEKVQGRGEYQAIMMVDSELSKEWDLAKDCARLHLPLFDDASLRQLMSLLSRTQRAFANDSSPAHMAVALGIPTAFVFGPSCVGDWHCYDRAVHPLYRVAVDCRREGPRDQEAFQFCTVDECSHQSCLYKIESEINL